MSLLTGVLHFCLTFVHLWLIGGSIHQICISPLKSPLFKKLLGWDSFQKIMYGLSLKTGDLWFPNKQPKSLWKLMEAVKPEESTISSKSLTQLGDQRDADVVWISGSWPLYWRSNGPDLTRPSTIVHLIRFVPAGTLENDPVSLVTRLRRWSALGCLLL